MAILFFLKLFCRIFLLILLVPKALVLWFFQKKTVLHVHVVWLKPSGVSAISEASIHKSIQQLKESFSTIQIDVISQTTIVEPEIQYFGCNFFAIFNSGFSILEKKNLWNLSTITAYFVEDVTDAGGCAFWGTSWCRIRPACTYDSTILAHEIGHLLNLPHHKSPQNVMYARQGGETNQLTSFQRFLILLSPFIRLS